jgi:hypothetical protein
MKYQLHPACAAWPEIPPSELAELADDIAANGLRDPITLTPDGLLIDGRNRARACDMAGVEPATVIYDGDPWLLSLSRNKHRRHMTADQIAMVAAKLATGSHGGDRRSDDFKIANANLKTAEVAAASGVREDQINSAKAVHRDGTPEEIEAVSKGAAKLRATADAIRARRKAKRRASANNHRSARVAAAPAFPAVRAVRRRLQPPGPRGSHQAPRPRRAARLAG